jgi:adenylyl cyclase-associated protein
LAAINELYSYVKESHRTGLVWNPNGENPEAAFSKIASQAAGAEAPTPTASAPAPVPSAGGPPPPPPPPPVMIEFDDAPTKAAPATTGASAVFAELNKGESVTAGLRKVDKSQMTHKNPSLRAGSTVPAEETAKKQRPPTPSKPGKYVLKKPAKTELQGNKWVVESHEGNSDIVIEGEINHAVYIYGCKNSTIRIKGKVNAVTMGKRERLL